MLEKDHPEIPLKRQAELLGISYSSLFYEPVPPSPRELAIKRRMDEIYTACPFYGSRKITFLLHPEFGVSRPTVQAYMREMGISAVVPGPNTSKPAPEHQIYPYLLRDATAERSNHIWCIDITYIPMAHGWLYLTAVLDWYSRYVISWALSQTFKWISCSRRSTTLCCKPSQRSGTAIRAAISPARNILNACNTKKSKSASMDSGRAHDNIFTERLWRTIKYEEVYLHEYAQPEGGLSPVSQVHPLLTTLNVRIKRWSI